MRNLCFIFITVFISTGAYAQYHVFKSKADKAFDSKNYYEAAYYYKKTIEGKKSSPTKIPFYSNGKATKKQLQSSRPFILYRLAESYRLYRDYSQAEEWYNKILVEGNESEYPLARLWYGTCLRSNKQFDAAIAQLNQFTAKYKGAQEYIILAKKEIRICIFAKSQYQLHEPVELSKMGAQWNAGGGDYALVKKGNNYWFTSTRFTDKNKKHLNRIYTSSDPAVTPGILDLKFDENANDAEYGTVSLDRSGKRMYLTRWHKKDDRIILAIYHSELSNSKWSIPQKLNNIVNEDGANAFQPFVTADGKRLFFVSDKPGGQGGDDIWVSNLDNEGNPLDAVNLGNAINTADDEQAPFYDDIHQRLVFSSKGFIGLGGFDLFESFQNKGKWSAPINLGYPINSSKDDLYYYADPGDINRFYISSDRESECCLNLFEGHYKHKFIKGIVIDCDTRQQLPGVKISLTDSLSKQTLKQSETSSTGNYVFEVDGKHSYKVILEKNSYFTKTFYASASPRTDTLVNPDICLQPFKVDKPITIKNILYDFNKATLRPESKIALDAMVIIMQDNPHINIELASHTDSIGSDPYNLKLSQQRAQSCVDYIISKGIDKDRIVAKGYGKRVPAAPNTLPNGKDNPDGRQLNRRTEFTVKK